MNLIDYIICGITCLISFLTGISCGILMCCAWKGLRDEVNEIAKNQKP